MDKETLETIIEFLRDYKTNSITGDSDKRYEEGFQAAIDYIDRTIQSL